MIRVRAWVRAWVRARVRARVKVRVRARSRTSPSCAQHKYTITPEGGGGEGEGGEGEGGEGESGEDEGGEGEGCGEGGGEGDGSGRRGAAVLSTRPVGETNTEASFGSDGGRGGSGCANNKLCPVSS